MPDKKRVLFVDDEPRILDGLQRMLRHLRQDWEMSFVENAPLALECLAREPFDVIVTDMHMPRMNGAQLLTEVRVRYPHVVRIVLSGAADKGDVLNALGPIHQYLSKPCEADALKITLARVSALHTLLVDDQLQQLLSQIETLPSLPARYDELIGELQSPNPSMRLIEDIVMRDLGLAVKVVQLAQSGVFGARHIATPAEAVAHLGLDTLQAMTTSGQMFARFEPAQLETLALEPLWEHSVLVGRLAERIAAAEGATRTISDYAAMAGLFHDVGKLALAACQPERYTSALALVARTGNDSSEAERQIFHATHAEVGAYLLSLWGLPDPIVAATAYHHSPHPGIPKQFNVVTAVYVADCLANQTGETSQIDVAYLASLGLAGRLPEWQQLYQTILQERDTP